MTQQEAKALSIEVWQYLADHPEIGKKEYLPNEIFRKIKHFDCYCPLCGIYEECDDCPLYLSKENCNKKSSAYNHWRHGNDDERQQAAQKILGIIKAWKPKEETK